MHVGVQCNALRWLNCIPLEEKEKESLLCPSFFLFDELVLLAVWTLLRNTIHPNEYWLSFRCYRLRCPKFIGFVHIYLGHKVFKGINGVKLPSDDISVWFMMLNLQFVDSCFLFPWSKIGQDTKMRFSVEPPINSIRSSSSSLTSSSCSSPSQQQLPPHQPSDSSGFQQWHDAMRMVARLPGGVPPEFRRKVRFIRKTYDCVHTLAVTEAY